MSFRGRPKKGNEKRRTFSFSLSPVVDRRLNKYTNSSGSTRSEIVNDVMLAFLSMGKKDQAELLKKLKGKSQKSDKP